MSDVFCELPSSSTLKSKSVAARVRGVGTWRCRRPFLGSLHAPRFAKRFGPQAVGLFVTDELVLHEIVFQGAVEVERGVRRVAGDVRVARRLGISLRLAPRLHA